jgi:hypothetical protein
MQYNGEVSKVVRNFHNISHFLMEFLCSVFKEGYKSQSMTHIFHYLRQNFNIRLNALIFWIVMWGSSNNWLHVSASSFRQFAHQLVVKTCNHLGSFSSHIEVLFEPCFSVLQINFGQIFHLFYAKWRGKSVHQSFLSHTCTCINLYNSFMFNLQVFNLLCMLLTCMQQCPYQQSPCLTTRIQPIIT